MLCNLQNKQGASNQSLDPPVHTQMEDVKPIPKDNLVNRDSLLTGTPPNEISNTSQTGGEPIMLEVVHSIYRWEVVTIKQAITTPTSGMATLELNSPTTGDKIVKLKVPTEGQEIQATTVMEPRITGLHEVDLQTITKGTTRRTQGKQTTKVLTGQVDVVSAKITISPLTAQDIQRQRHANSVSATSDCV